MSGHSSLSDFRIFKQTQSPTEIRRLWLVASMLLWVALGLAACKRNEIGTNADASLLPNPSSSRQVSPPASEAARSGRAIYGLGIVGYNYTEVGIDDYSVNGTGAFNLCVSNRDAGGGSTVCCFAWPPATKLPLPIRIEWTRDGKTWCRKTAMLSDPGPTEPTTFEVHVYPDRHIEVAITDTYSPPRLKLSAAGAGYRVGKDVQKENLEAQRIDAQNAECRAGRFPVGE